MQYMGTQLQAKPKCRHLYLASASWQASDTLYLDLFMNVLRDWYTLINPNLFLIVSAEQKEIGQKKTPLCGIRKVFHYAVLGLINAAFNIGHGTIKCTAPAS